MREKDRLRQLILSEIQKHNEVIVTGEVLDKAFPEMSQMAQGITAFAFFSKGKRLPPLTRREQIEQFCDINRLSFEMDMIKNTGTFTLLVHANP